MPQEFYSLPLNIDAIMRQKEHPKCQVQQSIAQQLHLILTTAFGEFSINEHFGCAIWEHDFDNLTNGSRMKELIRQSLLQSISQHEKRIVHVQVDLLLKQEELIDQLNGRRVKKRMDINITALLLLTDEKFHYRDSFFVGPLSY